MSIILSSGKGAAAKLREGNSKKNRPERISRSENQVHTYLPTESTIVWNPKIDGTEHSFALDKESFDVWWNDSVIDAETDFSDTGSTIAFEMSGKKICINIIPGNRRTKYHMTLNGEKVKQVKQA